MKQGILFLRRMGYPAQKMMKYEIQGETLPVVVCRLKEGERMITENGGMSWMSPNMEMKTSSNGGVGKMFGRMFAGEKMFQHILEKDSPASIGSERNSLIFLLKDPQNFTI